MSNKIIGYKVFNPDWTCRDFQYEVGKSYKHNGDVELCGAGFHFCENLIDCFNYYSFSPENKVAVVEASGVITEPEEYCSKRACSEIYIKEEVSWDFVLKECNTGTGNSGYRNSGDRNSGNWNSGDRNSGNWNSGDWNSGDRNSGNWNSGDFNSGDWNSGDWNSGDRNSGNWNSGNWNSGDWNSGDWNSGDRNSGNWNSGDFNSGFFNTNTPETIRVFNKEVSFEEFDKWEKPSFLFFLNVVSDDGETIPYKESFQKAWDNAPHEEKEQMKKCPNFDADLFYEISGIRV